MSPKRTDASTDNLEDHSQDDWSVLDEFCSQTEYDEIGFDSWCSLHQSLDIYVDVRLSSKDASVGAVKIVEFAKSSLRAGERKVVSKQKKSVMFPPGIKNGDVIELKECGDENQDSVGSLFITVRYD